MEKSPVAWGIDIGHSSIKAVKIARVGDAGSVAGYSIEPITTGEDVDREEAVVKALTALATREQFGNSPVVACLSGRQIYAKTINIPVINPKKVDKMVELEARQAIPGNFDEVEWGYHLSPAPDGASNDVALFAAKRDIIHELVRKAKLTHINLVAVTVSSLALYNFIRADQDFPDDETVIVLDVGAENTDLVLYQGETLWMRTLALSGNDVTKVFMKKFRVSFEEAETLKRQIGESRQADKIFKVIEGCLNELVSEVQRSLGFYKQQNANAKLENVVISGNTFRLPNLPQFLADRLRYAIISLEDLEKLQVGAGIDREHFLQDLQSLGVATGCALQGCGLAKATVNLLPNTLRVERILREKRWAAVAALALIAICFATRYAVIQSVTTENSALVREITRFANEQKEREKKSREVLDKVGPRAQELATFATIGNRGLVTAVLDEVTEVVQAVVKERGPINDPAADPAKGADQDPHLQAAYLASITVPSFDYTAETGPFVRIADPRAAAASSPPGTGEVRRFVTVEVHVPKVVKGLNDKLLESFKKIPTPAHLKGMVKRDTLFSEVQVTGDDSGFDSYYFLDDHHTDAKGNVDSKVFQDERKVSVTVFIFKCYLSDAGKGGK